jgi:hypothetical protein
MGWKARLFLLEGSRSFCLQIVLYYLSYVLYFPEERPLNAMYMEADIVVVRGRKGRTGASWPSAGRDVCRVKLNVYM